MGNLGGKIGTKEENFWGFPTKKKILFSDTKRFDFVSKQKFKKVQTTLKDFSMFNDIIKLLIQKTGWYM